jgi:hypothetical protein
MEESFSQSIMVTQQLKLTSLTLLWIPVKLTSLSSVAQVCQTQHAFQL